MKQSFWLVFLFSSVYLTISPNAFANYKAELSPDECQFIRDAIQNGETDIRISEEPTDGVYECSSPIVIDRSDTSLIGEGPSRIKIRLAATSLSPLLIVGSAKPGRHIGEVSHRVRNITVANLELDGNRMEQIEKSSQDFYQESNGLTYETASFLSRQRQAECWGGKGCDLAHEPRSVIRNNGITIRGAENILLQNIVSKNNLSGGLVTEKHCENLKVVGFESFNNLFDGFAGYETKLSHFIGLYLHHNFASGVSIDLDFSFNQFTNSDFSHNRDNGVFARESTQNHFENIKIHDVCNNGVFLADSAQGRQSAATNYTFLNLDVRAMQKAFRINDATCVDTKIESDEPSRLIGLHGDLSLAEGAAITFENRTHGFQSPSNNHISENYTHDERHLHSLDCQSRSQIPVFQPIF